MPADRSMRASDRDRDRTADLLREHHALGRLDAAEFAERLDKSFNAKTMDELDELTADLPPIDLYPLPTASLPRNRVVRSDLPSAYVLGQGETGGGRIWHGTGRFSPGWLAALGSWSVLFVIAFVIWVLGLGALPVIVMTAIGAIMGVRWVAGPRQLGRGHSGGSRRQIGGSLPGEITGDGDHTAGPGGGG